MTTVMIQWLSTVLRRPTLRPGRLVHSHGRPTRTVNSQFVSFLQRSGFRRVNLDRYERSLRRRRLALAVCGWASALGLTWVVVESAKALSMF